MSAILLSCNQCLSMLDEIIQNIDSQKLSNKDIDTMLDQVNKIISMTKISNLHKDLIINKHDFIINRLTSSKKHLNAIDNTEYIDQTLSFEQSKLSKKNFAIHKKLYIDFHKKIIQLIFPFCSDPCTDNIMKFAHSINYQFKKLDEITDWSQLNIELVQKVQLYIITELQKLDKNNTKIQNAIILQSIENCISKLDILETNTVTRKPLIMTIQCILNIFTE